VYDVQHMGEDTILSLETTARYRPENPYQPARQWGWRQAPSSHLEEAILLLATDWPQSKLSKSLAAGAQLFSKIEGQSQHRSRNSLQLLRCLHRANRRSVDWT
jgi:hypothetical protein